MPDKPAMAVPRGRVEPAWRLREATAADRDRIIALRKRVFATEDPEKQLPEFWSWEFLEGPEGAARLFVAEHGDAIVGHYAIIPQDFVLQGAPTKGSIVVDVMTDPDYRFQGMFKKIGIFSLKSAADAVSFATGYPIRKEVMPGHLSIGWTIRQKLPVLVRPLDWTAVAARFGLPFGRVARALATPWRWVRTRMRPRPSSSECIAILDRSHCGELASVAEAGLAGFDTYRVRTARHFDWRYFANPNWKYEVLGLTGPRGLAAYVVTRRATLLGTESLAIVDLGCLPGAKRELAVLLDEATARGTAAGLAVAGAMISTGNAYYRALRSAGYYPGPHRFSLIVYALQQQYREALVRARGNWFLTWGDTDAI